MFISVLDLFKIGIGPSSSHTMGPMIAAQCFMSEVTDYIKGDASVSDVYLRCTLKGSLAFTGRGHATDSAIAMGLHGYSPKDVATYKGNLIDELMGKNSICRRDIPSIAFSAREHIVFDLGKPLPEHPNGVIFELVSQDGDTLISRTYFSIGGGFISTAEDLKQHEAPLKMESTQTCRYPFDSADSMMAMSLECGLSIAEMKYINEREFLSETTLDRGLDAIWASMKTCIENGLGASGVLPGGLNVSRRSKRLHEQLCEDRDATINDWLCAYAMAVNEENAAGHMVVTAPTNGAAGVIPSVLYYYLTHHQGTSEQARTFLLTASAIGGLIKHRSSISGAEVGCQGEVGSASAMAAAGLCALRGGTSTQIEHAAEIALEHHLGMTCDPVKGLVQVPCIERNGFGAIKAYAATSLALREDGQHFMSLDNCISAMRQTGLDMSTKYKETSLGGLAVSITEC